MNTKVIKFTALSVVLTGLISSCTSMNEPEIRYIYSESSNEKFEEIPEIFNAEMSQDSTSNYAWGTVIGSPWPEDVVWASHPEPPDWFWDRTPLEKEGFITIFATSLPSTTLERARTTAADSSKRQILDAMGEVITRSRSFESRIAGLENLIDPALISRELSNGVSTQLVKMTSAKEVYTITENELGRHHNSYQLYLFKLDDSVIKDALLAEAEKGKMEARKKENSERAREIWGSYSEMATDLASELETTEEAEVEEEVVSN